MVSCDDSCHELLLPEDVIIEILSRLPVKSVIRARAVCKNWYTIIKNPSFVTKHFNHDVHSSNGRLFVNRFDKISRKYIFSLFPDETLAGTPPMYKDVVAVDYLGLVASPYNGILCLCNPSTPFHSNRFALWNPATREFKALPVLPLNLPPGVVIFYENFGFGLDPKTNDYKLVWIWNTIDNKHDIREQSCGPYQVAVYTLSTDSWRYLDVALPYSIIDNPSSNTCIDGVYYWCATTDVDDDQYMILSFDMGDELFHEIHDIPCSDSSEDEFIAPILVPYYNNSLALFYHDSRPIVDIWVMMEEGCWTNLLTVQLLSTHYPLGFWKNGQLFMINSHSDESHAVLYDPETNETKDLGFRNWQQFLVYRESLVAIRGGDGFVEQDHLSDVDQVLNFSKTVVQPRKQPDIPDDEDFEISGLFLI